MSELSAPHLSKLLRLSKHHGLGNDFLIAVDPSNTPTADDAVTWCDRRTGFGADGLVLATQSSAGRSEPAEWEMILYNSDGSRAGISGNGIRCLGQALAMRDGLAEVDYRIHTDAGPRLVEVKAPNGATRLARVDMGPASPGPGDFERWNEVGVAPLDQSSLDMGNPHLVVLVDDAEAIDLAAIGPQVESDYALGLNIEFISTIDPSRIALRVWERGAGVTSACGSGACAAAVAATRWGLVEGSVGVEMDGGTALVEVSGTVHLTGPATFIGWVSPSCGAERLGDDNG